MKKKGLHRFDDAIPSFFHPFRKGLTFSVPSETCGFFCCRILAYGLSNC